MTLGVQQREKLYFWTPAVQRLQLVYAPSETGEFLWSGWPLSQKLKSPVHRTVSPIKLSPDLFIQIKSDSCQFHTSNWLWYISHVFPTQPHSDACVTLHPSASWDWGADDPCNHNNTIIVIPTLCNLNLETPHCQLQKSYFVFVLLFSLMWGQKIHGIRYTKVSVGPYRFQTISSPFSSSELSVWAVVSPLCMTGSYWYS